MLKPPIDELIRLDRLDRSTKNRLMQIKQLLKAIAVETIRLFNQKLTNELFLIRNERSQVVPTWLTLTSHGRF